MPSPTCQSLNKSIEQWRVVHIVEFGMTAGLALEYSRRDMPDEEDAEDKRFSDRATSIRRLQSLPEQFFRPLSGSRPKVSGRHPLYFRKMAGVRSSATRFGRVPARTAGHDRTHLFQQHSEVPLKNGKSTHVRCIALFMVGLPMVSLGWRSTPPRDRERPSIVFETAK